MTSWPSAIIAAHSGDEAVFRFRGASDEFVDKLAEQGAQEVELTEVHRGPAATTAAGILAQRLPGVAAFGHGGEVEDGERAHGQDLVSTAVQSESGARAASCVRST